MNITGTPSAGMNASSLPAIAEDALVTHTEDSSSIVEVKDTQAGGKEVHAVTLDKNTGLVRMMHVVTEGNISDSALKLRFLYAMVDSIDTQREAIKRLEEEKKAAMQKYDDAVKDKAAKQKENFWFNMGLACAGGAAGFASSAMGYYAGTYEMPQDRIERMVKATDVNKLLDAAGLQKKVEEIMAANRSIATQWNNYAAGLQPVSSISQTISAECNSIRDADVETKRANVDKLQKASDAPGGKTQKAERQQETCYDTIKTLQRMNQQLAQELLLKR